MAAFVNVQLGSYGRLQKKYFVLSRFKLFVFFYYRHRMKYSCYQDSSVVQSWFVYIKRLNDGCVFES